MAEYYVLNKANRELFMPFIPEYIRETFAKEEKIVIGAVEDNLAIGALTGTIKDSVFLIDYIAVSPDYQKKHIATEMIEFLQEKMDDMKVEELLATYSLGTSYAEALHNIFESTDFDIEQADEHAFKVADLKNVKNIAFFEGKELDVLSLENVPVTILRQFNQKLKNDYGNVGSVNWDNFDKEMSFVKINEVDEIEFCLLVNTVGGNVGLDWMHVGTKDLKDLSEILAALVYKTEATCGQDSYISVLDESAKAFFKGLLPNAEVMVISEYETALY